MTPTGTALALNPQDIPCEIPCAQGIQDREKASKSVPLLPVPPPPPPFPPQRARGKGREGEGRGGKGREGEEGEEGEGRRGKGGAAAGIQVCSRVLYPRRPCVILSVAAAAFEVAMSSPHGAFETLFLKANT
jgi:hypothetical protein